jgi:hypothetical protein
VNMANDKKEHTPESLAAKVVKALLKAQPKTEGTKSIERGKIRRRRESKH